MNIESTYLTDEELSQLIADVEAHELVSAPPDMTEEILARIDAKEQGEPTDTDSGFMAERKDKKREFQLYCFRVVGAAAAAIMMIFTAPKVSEAMLKFSEVVSEVPNMQEAVITARYATKEDALSDRGILADAFGDGTLFGNDFEWNIFK